MTKKIFNRKDPMVENDAIYLNEEDFVEKYKDTTANELVLKSVYKNFQTSKNISKEIEEIATVATDFVEPSEQEEVEEKIEEPKKVEKEKKETSSDKKPGRTPRMRELMKIHGKDDKPKIKRLLIEEGFDTDGPGFHSEWNRLKKQK